MRLPRSLVLAALVASSSAFALEGKWTPQQVLELEPSWLKKQGLELPVARLWDAKKGGGLLANAIALPGCSGAFVSATGLLVTNHHCVVSILQQHSTPEANLFEAGHLARRPEDEKPGKPFRIQVPRRFTDVTREVLAAIPAGADDLQRFKAIEAKEKELVAACEAKPAARCSFASYDGGLVYALTESFELADVRLVYAPPLAIGNFGGETDNWTWPRHTGDFALLRAYVAPDGSSANFDAKNVPYRPEYFFPLSPDGVKPGDFVAVLGYPGATQRALFADEMAERQDLLLPRTRDLLGEWIDRVETATRGSVEGHIAVADNLRGLQNGRKAMEGQLEGLARGHLLERQRAAEDELVRWAGQRPEGKAALAARTELLALSALRRESFEKDFLLDQLGRSSKALALSLTVARRAVEAQKPDLEREPELMEREIPRLRERLEREQKRLFQPADRALFLGWVRRALALPAGQRLPAVDALFASATDDLELLARVDRLLSGSKVLDPAERAKMFDEAPEALHARKDALLELGFALDVERRALKERRDRWSGATTRLRPTWRRLVAAHAGKPVAYDANGTLRVTFAHVQGFSPRDGVLYAPQTTLGGLLEKGTGAPPFVVPGKVSAAFAEGRFGRWKDRALGDVPACFLADGDTTGGNSGSPVIDGKGRLVGVNFDRVWENVANDFGFNPKVARNISVDARYLLWMLDQVEGAPALLEELGVKKR
jgi:hypothetical protein